MIRTKSSIRNASVALIGQLLSYVLNFIVRLIFVRILGDQYMGVNGLFTNIMSTLAFVELGMGASITIFLYKPVAQNDEKRIICLLSYYKKAYRIIGMIIFFMAICIIPFLPIIIKDITIPVNTVIVYFLFIIMNVIPYFYAAEKTILDVNQEKYIITIVHYLSNIVMLIIQAILLSVYKNYYLYIAIQLISTFTENVIISIIARKKYNYINQKSKNKLEKSTKHAIIKKMKAMTFQQIGLIVQNSTDNILISSMIGVRWVGIYSNYYLLISVIESIISQVFSSIQSSIGNLNVFADEEKKYKVYNCMLFINFWLVCFFTVCMGVLIDPFITMFFGTEYLMPKIVVYILIFNIYILNINKANSIYKYATGHIEEDKYAAIIGAIINLVLSIILAKWIGISGIFIGTTISTLTTKTFVEPYILHKYVFERKMKYNVKQYVKYLIFTVLSSFIIITALNTFSFNNQLIDFIIKAIITVIVINIFIIVVYHRTEEYKYTIEILNSNQYLNKILKTLKII